MLLSLWKINKIYTPLGQKVETLKAERGKSDVHQATFTLLLATIITINLDI